MAKKKPAPVLKDKMVMLRLSTSEWEVLKADAAADGRDLSSYIRHRLKTHPAHLSFLKRRERLTPT